MSRKITTSVNSERFKQIKERDSIKTQYCINNNIKLIRLPFFEKDRFLKF